MSEQDGGPAFPGFEHVIADRIDSKGEVKVITGEPHGGISVRDYFAGHALAGIFANAMFLEAVSKALAAKDSLSDGNLHFTIGTHAYQMADAMLKARTQP